MSINLRSATHLGISQESAAGVSRGFNFVVDTLVRWGETQRSRHDLAQLDDQLLRDIGLTPGEAAREAAVPFWKV
jgi:uncharacterized protein YjiS (DUF1127 family)